MTDSVDVIKYVDQRFTDLEHKIDLVVSNQDKAVSLARQSIENRLGAMNELREQINRERGIYATRESTESLEKSLEVRIRTMETTLANYAGRFWAVGIFSSIISSVVSILVRLIWH